MAVGLSANRPVCTNPPFWYSRRLPYFIDAAHAAGLNVILDWVPATSRLMTLRLPNLMVRTCMNQRSARRLSSGLEHADLQLWSREVSNFLVGNALYWIERFGMMRCASMRWRR